MYEEYYGFAQPPFNLTPDPRFLYQGASHAEALRQVLEAIARREAFCVLTGETGTGKTTLCRALLEQVDASTLTALVANPFLSIDELLRDVLLAFGVASRETVRGGRLAAATTAELVTALHEFLRTLGPLGARALIIIDEAQHLSPSLLEEVRVLSGFELAGQHVLQVLIVGQLPLLDVLARADLRQVNHRIGQRSVLEPLNGDEAAAYITHRLAVAQPARPVRFAPEAVAVVHRATGGVPRLINLVCDRALMVGQRAGVDEISPDIAAEAAGMLGIREVDAGVASATRSASGRSTPLHDRRRPDPRVVAAAALVLLCVLGTAVALSMAAGSDAPLPSTPAPTSPPAQVVPPALDVLVRTPAPPHAAGAYSVLIGTYDSADEALAVEEALLRDGLPVYVVDVTFAAGTRRRILIGRYATLADAQAVVRRIAGSVADAIVVFGWQETLRRLGDSRPVHYTAGREPE